VGGRTERAADRTTRGLTTGQPGGDDGPEAPARARLVTPRRATAVVLVLMATFLAPKAAGALPSQDGSDAEQQREDVRERSGEVALEVDALEAQVGEITTALRELDANVAAREASLSTANEAAESAASRLDEAEAAVADTEARVQALEIASDNLAADSFMAPPSAVMIDSLRADSVNDGAVMQALVEIQADNDADVLGDLERAQEDLEGQRDEAEAASAEANEARSAAQSAYDEVAAARDQQAQFANEAQTALDHRLTEAANLEAMDAELSRQIAEEQAELARQLEESGAGGVGAPTPVGDVVVATVSCHNGSTITVADSIAGNVQSMLDAAAADGVLLCGWGYRSTEEQIALRRQNCGDSEYLIYEAPSSSCSPPTARPNTSEHEKGLAIDFDNCSSHSTECWVWLDGHAATYGMYPFSVEPWHWSTTGT
jgi:LAS superfamily LD-carboxypeptidase LdcB